jgi:hypothetical protein
MCAVGTRPGVQPCHVGMTQSGPSHASTPPSGAYVQAGNNNPVGGGGQQPGGVGQQQGGRQQLGGGGTSATRTSGNDPGRRCAVQVTVCRRRSGAAARRLRRRPLAGLEAAPGRSPGRRPPPAHCDGTHLRVGRAVTRVCGYPNPEHTGRTTDDARWSIPQTPHTQWREMHMTREAW